MAARAKTCGGFGDVAKYITDYRVLKFFWETFGLREADLNGKSAVWVLNMLSIAEAESQELEEIMNQARNRMTNKGGRF